MSDTATEPKSKLQWYHPTPGKLITGLLMTELCLLLADRFSLFGMEWGGGWNVIWAVGIFLAVIVAALVWFVLALLFRCRFQFGIITLFLLMCLTAIVGGWSSWKWNMVRRQREAVEVIQELGGAVNYDYRLDSDHKSGHRYNFRAEPPGPAWFRNRVGVDFFSDVVEVVLIDARLTDTQFKKLEGLVKLDLLMLNHTEVTDTRLKNLQGLTRLRVLWLPATQITDTGLEHLKELTNLEVLHLEGTQATHDGVNELRQALPNCKILH